jgi:hypothetical protein
MTTVKTHSFNGVQYMIDVGGPFMGICDSPHVTQKTNQVPAIRLSMGLPCGDAKGARQGLVILFHEMLHASKWSLTEDEVVRISNEMGRLMWRLGYRRIDQS